MWKRIFLILVAGLVTSACTITFNYEEGSGNVVREQRDIEPVNQITFEGIGKLIVVQGSVTSLEIEAEDNIMPRIVTDVERGKLRIGFDTERWQNIIRPTKTIIYTLQIEDLTDLSLSGLGDVTLEDVDLDLLTIRLSGAGSIEASGTVDRLEINVSGAGSLESGDLESEQVTINLSGAGNAVVWAIESLDVSISGLGNVSYYGEPELRQSVTGLGNIQALGDR